MRYDHAMPRRTRSCTTLALSLLAAAGCGQAPVRVAWEVQFESPALSARAVRVVASLHDGRDCAGAVRYVASVPHGGGTMSVPPSVAPGTYTFCADAVDDACSVFASGHTTVDLRGTPPRVVVLVVSAATSPACAGSACDHGTCIAPDGGTTDGGPPPSDAAMDAPAPTDLGVDEGVDEGVDAGVYTCVTRVISAPTAPACTFDTGTCIFGCIDDACSISCVNADPHPAACFGCIDDAYDSCANANGCQAAYDAFVCCQHGCIDATSPSCCPPELAAWNTCLDGQTALCNPADMVCYGA